LFEAQDKIDNDKDNLIQDIEGRLKQEVKIEEVFTLRWKVI
jgi:hypothetical protein